MKKIFGIIFLIFVLVSCDNTDKTNKELHWNEYIEIISWKNIWCEWIYDDLNDIIIEDNSIKYNLYTKKWKELIYWWKKYEYDNWDYEFKHKLESWEYQIYLVRDWKVIAKWYSIIQFPNWDYEISEWLTRGESFDSVNYLLRNEKIIARWNLIDSFNNWYYKFQTKEWGEILLQNWKKILWDIETFNIKVYDDWTISYKKSDILTTDKGIVSYHLILNWNKKIDSIWGIAYMNNSYSYTDKNNISYIIINWEEVLNYDLNNWEYTDLLNLWFIDSLHETSKRVLSWWANSLLTLTHSLKNGDYWFYDPEWKLNLIIWWKIKIIESWMIFIDWNFSNKNEDYSYNDFSNDLYYLIRDWKEIAVWTYVKGCDNWNFYYRDKNEVTHLMGKK